MLPPRGLFLRFLVFSALVGGSLAKRRRQERKEEGKAEDTTYPPWYNNTDVYRPLAGKFAHPKPDDVQVGCKELRSKRYISDGFCTSVKPVTEVVCTGHCLPIRNLPWYAEFIKVWARTKILQWRCVDDVVRRKRVRLMCENGESRTYRIKVVRSCKCKRYLRQQNQSHVNIAKIQKDITNWE